MICHTEFVPGSVLLAHAVAPIAANRVAWAVSALGAVLALTVTIAQLKVHSGS